MIFCLNYFTISNLFNINILSTIFLLERRIQHLIGGVNCGQMRIAKHFDELVIVAKFILINLSDSLAFI